MNLFNWCVFIRNGWKVISLPIKISWLWVLISLLIKWICYWTINFSFYILQSTSMYWPNTRLIHGFTHWTLWVKSKPVHWMLLHFHWYFLLKWVLYHCTILNGEEDQQLVLPVNFCKKILKSVHNDSGHQWLEQIFEFTGQPLSLMFTNRQL